MTKKASYITLGCKLNYAETSTYERNFIRAGYESVPWNSKADLYIINTCSVTEHADRKSRNIIRKIHRTAPEATIVVTGCYAQLKRQEVEALEGVSLVFGADEKSSLVKRTLDLIDGKASAGPAENEYRTMPSDSATFAAYSSGEERTRSFLKVQDGCDNFCAYCTVPFARGRSRSISIDTAVSEAEKIAAAGVKEIVLTGVNTGDFGRKSGESFLELLKRLNAVEGIERYRISSIEPNLLTEDIIDWIASGTKFQPHFHIPLQSGSDTVLKDVGRKYTTEFFAEKIDYIRSKMNPKPGETYPDGSLKPSVFFGIDVIAGLPGETDELFQETYDFLKNRIRPAFIHIFPYSRRAGTRSAMRKDQVQDCVKTKRVEMLEGLCRSLNEEFIDSQKGVKEKVLFEESCTDGKMSGYTGNYIRVERNWDESLAGKLVEVTL
ncbi:MAG: tRNA (N(6)-L-threonylcarbamoyladenosine(37)-C(2))-methylthiotransferase MtaB [Bacteroidales bacterium]|jgi:threonylcarbamoyladenosine tRNA methylthiotransferase MtaB|nr:tRNA (N(6)-L-threonylcarbamoyladenosine(37)-C(2))-methylthiotransferase MtaB [Bacteroidales bacterium]